MRLLISALTLTVLIIVSATAGNTEKHDGLMVKDVWSRATLAKNGATYMTIFNHGSHMDRLVAVESSVSEKAEMHTHSIKDGVKMTTDWYHKVYKEKQKPEIVSKIQIIKYMNDSKIN